MFLNDPHFLNSYLQQTIRTTSLLLKDLFLVTLKFLLLIFLLKHKDNRSSTFSTENRPRAGVQQLRWNEVGGFRLTKHMWWIRSSHTGLHDIISVHEMSMKQVSSSRSGSLQRVICPISAENDQFHFLVFWKRFKSCLLHVNHQGIASIKNSSETVSYVLTLVHSQSFYLSALWILLVIPLTAM